MSRDSAARSTSADVFAALGSVTRLELLARLGDGKDCSITELTDGLSMTRQAITKHLRVLQQAGIVDRRQVGRETRFVVQPDSVSKASEYLLRISDQWDESIQRLKDKVEC